MVYLILSVLCSVAIANLLTWFNRGRGNDIYYIFAGNYLVASLFSWGTNAVPIREAGVLEIGLGILAGSFFLINFIIYQNNIVRNGQSIAVGTMRISLIIPTLLSIFIFNETLVFIKYLAILLIIVAFMRLSFMGHIRHIPLALLLFGVTGITDSFMKLYDEFGRDDPGLYLSILFTAALCLTIILIIIKQRRVNIQSILLGFILGIPNQLTTKFFMRSLTQVSATVAYPLLASGVVLFALFTDAGIWRRKFSLRELAAYAVLVAGIVLLNIKW